VEKTGVWEKKPCSVIGGGQLIPCQNLRESSNERPWGGRVLLLLDHKNGFFSKRQREQTTQRVKKLPKKEKKLGIIRMQGGTRRRVPIKSSVATELNNSGERVSEKKNQRATRVNCPGQEKKFCNSTRTQGVDKKSKTARKARSTERKGDRAGGLLTCSIKNVLWSEKRGTTGGGRSKEEKSFPSSFSKKFGINQTKGEPLKIWLAEGRRSAL